MTEPLTDGELAAIRARAEAATRGPWGVLHRESEDTTIAADLNVIDRSSWTCRREIVSFREDPMDNDPDHGAWFWEDDVKQQAADAEFIAHAREDVPALLAEITRLRALLDEPAHEVTVSRGVNGWQWSCTCDEDEDDYPDRFTAELAGREHIDDNA